MPRDSQTPSPSSTPPQLPKANGPSSASKLRNQFKRRFSLQPHREEVSTPSSTASGGLPSILNSSTDSGSGSPSVAVPPSPPACIKYKVVVLGGPQVGKTSLITQFLYDEFPDKYESTIEEMYYGDFKVDGVRLTLDILDTSGVNEFPAMRALSISSADAFVLVYSITDAGSFEEVRVIRDTILQTKGEGVPVPIVVVGNKFDLAEGARDVEYKTSETIVTVDWGNGFVEASAKNHYNVSEVFKELLNQAKVKYNLSPALRRRRVSLPGHNARRMSVAQLRNLQSIKEKHSDSKRGSCILS